MSAPGKRRHDKVCTCCGHEDLPFAAGLPEAVLISNPQEITVGQISVEYIDQHLKQHSSERTWRNAERSVRNYWKPISDIRACELKRFTVLKWFHQIAETHGQTTANRAAQLLRSIYNKALDWEILPPDLRNPCQRIKLFRLEPRERYLSRHEIEKLLTAIEGLRYRTTQHFLLMCLFTGQRRANVAAMRWEDLNLELSAWRIPKTKNGRSHLVPLIDPAIQLLRCRRELSNDNSPFVFPSDRSPSGHLTKPELAWKKIKERTGLTDARIHDLRRTLASYAAIEGVSLPVLAKLLGHRDFSSTAVYARLDIEPVRDAMNRAVGSFSKK